MSIAAAGLLFLVPGFFLFLCPVLAFHDGYNFHWSLVWFGRLVCALFFGGLLFAFLYGCGLWIGVLFYE